MDYKQILLSKNGYVTLTLAKEFLKYSVGDKIPTVTEISDRFNLARGTVQNALKTLQNNDAIRIESKGHLGSYLIKKNMKVLLEFAGITSIVGVMPLPYSRRYEGLASGLLVAMENHYNIPASMAYMRGSLNRISMLESNRYDYAIISRDAAEQILDKYNNIIIVKSFGRYSYLSEHVIIFKNNKYDAVEDGMKIGVDNDSVDQKRLTEAICKGKKVEFVHIDYSQSLKRVMSGDIDASVWNKDEILDKMIEVNYVEIQNPDILADEAVLVVNKEEPEMASLLDEIIDVKTVTNIQKLVLEGKITPSY